MSDFQKFAKLVNERFTRLSALELFSVGGGSEILSQTYLAAFPAGTDPVYKTNTEHNCSCCKNFIHNLGGVVAIIDGQVQSIWDVEGAPHPYQTVADSMASLVRSLPIETLFRGTEPKYGAEFTMQQLEDKSAKRWNHFHGTLAPRHYMKEPGAVVGQFNTSREMLKRALTELKPSAIQEVLGLINSNGLYRGEEHKAAVLAFAGLQVAYDECDGDKEVFLWALATSPAARFRNTVIGTLVTDLSNGVDLEDAVRSFEVKVAPTNYKRPTALITPAMVKGALETVGNLGLAEALERRFAVMGDVTVNNVLWADRAAKGRMKGGIEQVLLQATFKPVDNLQPTPISIEEFMEHVLPNAQSMDLLVQGNHQANFVSITAPVHAESGKLFKWDNPFAWSYDGNVADSIREKVKAAGGNVTNAALRISLAWHNSDDLDLHVTCPDGHKIYFGDKHHRTGSLDVDMNAGYGPKSRSPVENVSFTKPLDGEYMVVVNQYCKRETADVGFTVELEAGGKLTQLNYPHAVQGQVVAARPTYKGGVVTEVLPGHAMTSRSASVNKWGVDTETFVRVETLMLSPNYWDGNAVGNKHWFFLLEGCKNPDTARGVYNEFLTGELEQHRKVFEVLGNKTQCAPKEDQLSGLGFSSTRGDTVTVKVATASRNRVFSIAF